MGDPSTFILHKADSADRLTFVFDFGWYEYPVVPIVTMRLNVTEDRRAGDFMLVRSLERPPRVLDGRSRKAGVTIYSPREKPGPWFSQELLAREDGAFWTYKAYIDSIPSAWWAFWWFPLGRFIDKGYYLSPWFPVSAFEYHDIWGYSIITGP